MDGGNVGLCRRTHDVDMQVEHFLPAAFACIDQGFEAVGQTCRFGDLRDFQHHFAQEGLMFGRGVCQRVEMDFRNQQQMNRRSCP